MRQVEDTPEKLVPVPLLGIVAAGPALLAEENHLGDILVGQSIAGRGGYFALQVSGDSMKGAGMKFSNWRPFLTNIWTYPKSS